MLERIVLTCPPLRPLKISAVEYKSTILTKIHGKGYKNLVERMFNIPSERGNWSYIIKPERLRDISEKLTGRPKQETGIENETQLQLQLLYFTAEEMPEAV